MSKKFNRKAMFVREFPFLSQIPQDLGSAGRIRVERGTDALLRETGNDHRHADGYGGLNCSTIFYAVSRQSFGMPLNVVKLQTGGVEQDVPCPVDGVWPGTRWSAEPNGVQLHKLGLKPNFIVRWHEDGSGGAHYWTIYKMDKFDYDGYYKDLEMRRSEQEQADQEHLMSMSVHPERCQRLWNNMTRRN